MTFLISEDDALKTLLKGLKVTDQKSGTTRNVGVWFGQPDQEITDQKYPYMVIDMVDISEDPTRAMRGLVKPYYLADPTNVTDTTETDPAVPYNPDLHDWKIHVPIPVNIDYQITTYARQPRHDREILSQMLHTKIPMRFAVLDTDDGTRRRLDLLDVTKRDVTEAGKRLFVNVFTVRVSSEIAETTYNRVYKALQVNVTGPDNPGSQVIGREDWTPIEYTNTQP